MDEPITKEERAYILSFDFTFIERFFAAYEALVQQLEAEIERLNQKPCADESGIILDSNEIRFEGEISPLNGWTAGQLAQQMGANMREQIKPGWKVKKAVVRLSAWLDKKEYALKRHLSGCGEEEKK